MTGSEAIQAALEATRGVLERYLDDLSDADLLARPSPNANHIAWQLGHLIWTEYFLVTQQLTAAAMPALPAGFAEAHGKDRAGADDGFLTRREYLGLFARVRAATVAAVDGLSDADLDRPSTGRVAESAPTLGAVFLLVSNHTLMHAGQFTAVRRALGKPVLF